MSEQIKIHNKIKQAIQWRLTKVPSDFISATEPLKPHKPQTWRTNNSTKANNPDKSSDVLQHCVTD